MVQNINRANPYGSISKIGTTDNGRVIYQVIDNEGKIAGRMSVAQKDSDTFEKSYNDIMESAPKLQKFAEKHSTPESMQKLKKTANWTIGIGTLLGAGVGIFGCSKLKITTSWKQVLATLGTTIAGFIGGVKLASALTMPDGVAKFTKATQNISKLDIQPLE